MPADLNSKVNIPRLQQRCRCVDSAGTLWGPLPSKDSELAPGLLRFTALLDLQAHGPSLQASLSFCCPVIPAIPLPSFPHWPTLSPGHTHTPRPFDSSSGLKILLYCLTSESRVLVLGCGHLWGPEFYKSLRDTLSLKAKAIPPTRTPERAKAGGSLCPVPRSLKNAHNLLFIAVR